MEESGRGDRLFGEYEVVHSSGTSGEPTYFVYGEDEWLTVLAAGVRAVQDELGFTDVLRGALGGVDVLYVAATGGRFAGVKAMESSSSVLDSELTSLDVNRPVDEWREELADEEFDVVVGYPSGVKLVCDLVDAGDVELNPDVVVTGGEPLSPELRRYVESTWDVDVRNLYGAAESLILGVERSKDEGVYLFDDLNLVEASGDVTYVTPLHRKSQPLIRYRLTDRLEPRERTGDEGLPFSRVEAVVGRSDELMWFDTDGGDREFLHPFVVDEIECPGLQRYQFVQTSTEGFDVRTEVTEDVDFDDVRQAVRKQVEGILEEKGLGRLEFEVVEVDDVPVDPETGKRRMVVKEV